MEVKIERILIHYLSHLNKK